jgi:aconitase A
MHTDILEERSPHIIESQYIYIFIFVKGLAKGLHKLGFQGLAFGGGLCQGNYSEIKGGHDVKYSKSKL